VVSFTAGKNQYRHWKKIGSRVSSSAAIASVRRSLGIASPSLCDKRYPLGQADPGALDRVVDLKLTSRLNLC